MVSVELTFCGVIRIRVSSTGPVMLLLTTQLVQVSVFAGIVAVTSPPCPAIPKTRVGGPGIETATPDMVDVVVGVAVTVSAPLCDEVKLVGTPEEVVADTVCGVVEDRPAIEGDKERNTTAAPAAAATRIRATTLMDIPFR
jgi:hypothetical protein